MNRIFLFTLFCITGFGAVAQQNLDYLLIARNTGEKVLATNDTIRVFGFAQTLSTQPGVPGPTIIANQGDSVHIDLWNVSQGAPHTIHLHGLDVDQQNDGVPHLSFEVGHMDHGFYHFKAPHAGTYLYHCHVASTIHVQAGMYGLIIVKPTNGSNTTWDGGYPYTSENSFFMSEIDTNWHTDSVLLHEHDTTMMIQPLEIPEFHPQYFLINGFSDQQLIDEGVEFNSAVGQFDYTRLTNIGFYGIRVIFPSGLNAQIIDSDGRPFGSVEVSDTVFVYPGERYGVLTQPSTEFQDSIVFEYFDLNTMVNKGTQVVSVDVSGYVDVAELHIEATAYLLAPNPSSEFTSLQFSFDETKELTVKVYSLRGQLLHDLKTKEYHSGSHNIDLRFDGSKTGLYFVHVIENHEELQVLKWIKQ